MQSSLRPEVAAPGIDSFGANHKTIIQKSIPILDRTPDNIIVRQGSYRLVDLTLIVRWSANRPTSPAITIKSPGQRRNLRVVHNRHITD